MVNKDYSWLYLLSLNKCRGKRNCKTSSWTLLFEMVNFIGK